MQNKIITVVGGSGFLGRYVVKLLAAHGYLVRVISRNPEAALSLKTAGEVGQVTLVSGDITRPETLKGKLDNSYAVVNLVGILFESGNQKFDAVQAKGAGKLAELAKLAGAERFVQISAIGADGVSRSRYARTKAAGEIAVKTSFSQSVILRPSVIFGTEDNFFNKFAFMASISPIIPLIGGGKTKFQPVYAMDVAQAVLKVLELDTAKGRVFELGGAGIYSFRELIEFICRTINRKPLLLNLPFGVAGFIGMIGRLLPAPPLTRDQVILLKSDNVVSAGAKTLADLGIKAQSVENIVPLYLARYARRLA